MGRVTEAQATYDRIHKGSAEAAERNKPARQIHIALHLQPRETPGRTVSGESERRVMGETLGWTQLEDV